MHSISAQGAAELQAIMIHIPNAKVPCCVINPMNTNGIYAVDHQNLLGYRYTPHRDQLPASPVQDRLRLIHIWEIPMLSSLFLVFQSHTRLSLNSAKNKINNSKPVCRAGFDENVPKSSKTQWDLEPLFNVNIGSLNFNQKIFSAQG